MGRSGFAARILDELRNDTARRVSRVTSIRPRGWDKTASRRGGDGPCGGGVHIEKRRGGAAFCGGVGGAWEGIVRTCAQWGKGVVGALAWGRWGERQNGEKNKKDIRWANGLGWRRGRREATLGDLVDECGWWRERGGKD